MSTIKISNIYAEDLFEWFLNHVFNPFGSGIGYIVCENYRDVAIWFKEWYEKMGGEASYLSSVVYEDGVSFRYYEYDCHFRGDSPVMLDHIYVFIVEGDCRFKNEMREDKWEGRMVKSSE